MEETATQLRRKRPCGGAFPRLHQEAHCQPPACKRRCSEAVQEKKRTGRGSKENRELRRSRGTQNLKIHDRRPPVPGAGRLEELKCNWTGAEIGRGDWDWSNTLTGCRFGPWTEVADGPAIRAKISKGAGNKTRTAAECGSGLRSVTTASETGTDLVWDMEPNWPESGTGVKTTAGVGADTRGGSGSGEGATTGTRGGTRVEFQSSKPEVRVALVRKTSNEITRQTLPSNQTTRQTLLNQWRSGHVEGLTPGGSARQGEVSETLLSQRRLSLDRKTRDRAATSKVKSRSSARVASVENVEVRTSRRRSSQGRNSESLPWKRRPLLHRATAEAGSWRSYRDGQDENILPRTRHCSLGQNADPTPRKRRKIHPYSLRGRGELRLSVTPGEGWLIIQIHKARGLMGNTSRSCDSYVKLAVIPDVDHSTRRKTETVLNSKSPEYNKTFLLAVSTEDHQKRLLVTVFRRPPDNRHSELIGCMSFGIRSLITSVKHITGWFYLLGEEYGRRKHLKVTSQQSKPRNSQEERGGAMPTDCELRKTPDATLAKSDTAPTDLNRATAGLTILNHGTAGLTDLNCGSAELTNLNHGSAGLTDLNRGTAGLTDRNCGTARLTDLNRGTAGLTDRNCGTAGLTDRNCGTARLTDLNRGTAGLTDLNHGTAGLTILNRSTAGLTDLNRGTAGLTDLNCGTAGLTDLNRGTAGLTDRNCGTAGLTDRNCGTAGLTDLNRGTARLTDLNHGTAGLTILNRSTAGLTDLNCGTAGLTDLNCGIAGLTDLNRGTARLTDLNCGTARLTDLNRGTARLTDLNCGTARLTDLNRGTARLTDLNCGTARLTDLNRGTARLTDLNCGTARLTDLNRGTARLTDLNCGTAGLTDQNCDTAGLTVLNRSTAGLTDLNRGTAGLTHLTCGSATLTNLNRGTAGLTDLNCGTAGLTDQNCDTAGLTVLNRSTAGLTDLNRGTAGLTHLTCGSATLTNLNRGTAGLTDLNRGTARLTDLNCGTARLTDLNRGTARLTDLNCGTAGLTDQNCDTAGLTVLNRSTAGLTDLNRGTAGLTHLTCGSATLTNLNRGTAGLTDLNRGTAGLTHLNCGSTGLTDLNHGTIKPTYSSDLGNTNYSASLANTNYASYISTLCSSTNRQASGVVTDGNNIQQLTVSIVRGKDGFGFTICSDCPVRVQAVDPGGPAHHAGLQQSDSVLQLNGLPVETWKCVDLAHAIRSCTSQIVLVVWRGFPEGKSCSDGLIRPPTRSTMTVKKLLPHPAHSKYSRRRGQGSVGSGVRSSLGALGSLWRDRKEEREEEEEEVTEYSPRTTTLKGTRVTSSNGDNYIILSPINPGSQVLQPVYHDRNGTIGRLYQSHSSRSQNLLHDPRPRSSQPSFNSHTANMAPPLSSTSSSSSSSTSSVPPGSYGNYQNCTIVQSHLPCSGYGTYVTLAPKTLIFPVFVQPLDLCSPDRTLLMSEEMILHQGNMLPTKVTVLIYSDLLLLTREDEAGRCNVLQSPLYLNTLLLREVAAEPLQLYILQCVQSFQSVFSLEAFSLEQKTRIHRCLHDNIQLQLVATETGHSRQLPDLQSDFGLLSVVDSDLPYRSSSPYSSYSSSDPAHRASSPYAPLCDPHRPPSPSPYSPSSPSSFSSSPPPFGPLPTYTSPPPARTLSPSAPPSYSSSKRSVNTPIWKERERGRGEEEERRRRKREVKEERQQGEGESASETSESMVGVGGVLPPPSSPLLPKTSLYPEEEEEEEYSDEDEEEEEEEGGVESTSPCRPGVLRRSLSEGSLLQEPRSPRFLSDSTIHRLTRPSTLDSAPSPALPSPRTLRRQLTKEGGSVHQMLLLLNGMKDPESVQKRKKTKSLAADVRSRLAFLRRRNNLLHGNSLEKALRNHRPSPGEVLRWAESFEALLANKYGLAVFRHFLKSEFSEENLDFWLAVEKYKEIRPLSKMAARADKIYSEFISTNAARQVNVDSSVRELTHQNLRRTSGPASFQLIQDQIYSLMETDSYPRFLRSRLYTQLANHNTLRTQTANQNEPGSAALANYSGGYPATQLPNQKRPVSMVDQL